MKQVVIAELRVYVDEAELAELGLVPPAEGPDETAFELAEAKITESSGHRRLCLVWRATRTFRQVSLAAVREGAAPPAPPAPGVPDAAD